METQNINESELLQTKDIVNKLLELLESKKAENITAIDVTNLTTIADYVIIVTANSTPHASSMGKAVVDFFLDSNNKDFLFKRNVELNNPWILIDAKDIIIHIFMPEEREFYNIEKLYAKGKILS